MASNPGGRWNSKWTFGKVDAGVFFPNSVDGVAVTWQRFSISYKKNVPFHKACVVLLLIR